MRTVLILAVALLLLPFACAPTMLALASPLMLGLAGDSIVKEGAVAGLPGLPQGLERLYQTAANTCAGLDWTVLAAIHKIESDFGRSNLPGVKAGTNHAGAAGPMQFLISTWGGSARIKIGSRFNGYASDGDGDGWGDVYNTADALFAAAKYLCRHGAPRAVRQAVYAYNHSWDYVDSVLALAKTYADASELRPEQPRGDDRVTPRMRTARDLLLQRFRIPFGVGCYRQNDSVAGGGRGEHHLGRACDFMLSRGTKPSPGNQALGDAIAAWFQANAARLGVSYVIWKQRIWSPARAGEGWRTMSDRGGVTDNHFDHVHVTVL
ncbi:hypothetical protein GCM10009733_006190 [Nonomuraea maheshkhaliensis]|uniref:ARB-07466-like C-terminal domain-containing protein n=1 Tax=Nonomuraea maheshkhaliensis TaxID=419590 RepID=A0ABP4QJC6_9ACTN